MIADDDGHGWNHEGGYDMARTWMQRFPQIDAMFGGDDSAAVGMATAAVDRAGDGRRCSSPESMV